MEFYKVPGDFFVTLVTVNLVPYDRVLYICICLRDAGVEEAVHLM
jgi:hypothetical protein